MISLTGADQSAFGARSNGSIRKNRFAAPQSAPDNAAERGSYIGADCVTLLQVFSFERERSAQVDQR
jgi:hypothetical protein